jgi:predicted membrane channel-forming protein YqfA (hemolysin III family)
MASDDDKAKTNFMSQYNVWGALFGGVVGLVMFYTRESQFMSSSNVMMLVAGLAAFLMVESMLGVLELFNLSMQELNVAFFSASAVFYGMQVWQNPMNMYS